MEEGTETHGGATCVTQVPLSSLCRWGNRLQPRSHSQWVEGLDLERRSICSFLGTTPSCIEDLNPGGRLRGDLPGALSGLTSVPRMLRIGAAARSTGRAPTASPSTSPALRSLTLGLPPPSQASSAPSAPCAQPTPSRQNLWESRRCSY